MQAFAALVEPLAPVLRHIDEVALRYRSRNAAGLILPNTLDALRIELTYHSNAIEGNTLTLRETQLVLEGLSVGGDRPLREIYEARNHDRALRLIESHAPGFIKEAQILADHREVLADIDSANAGRYRDGRVLISGTYYTPPGSHRFGELIPAILELANRPEISSSSGRR